ncbi:hypothetical protein EMPS_08511 [Entomortierella parvispora]|uniref:Glutathione S-transferase n=1 Tax=Entomortierella parvispora TaxID=205924 RepID=A0A9P3HGE1_9FUNG|nr:hypothetical protein EMPS_08511 [Entomortierella parvispora]
MVHAYFSPDQAESYNHLVSRTDSKFEVQYFGWHALGGTTRYILAIGGANFKSITPAEGTWGTEHKAKAPFGYMPLLRETSPDGKYTLLISESDAIERYLSHKFGLLGKNGYEELIINQFVSSNNAMAMNLFLRYFSILDNEEFKAANKAKLLGGTIPSWIAAHEKHLCENTAAVAKGLKDGNGHYVGETFSLADVKTPALVDMIRVISGDDMVSKEKTPALWKVKETMEASPSVKAWKATPEFKEISERNFQLIGCY